MQRIARKNSFLNALLFLAIFTSVLPAMYSRGAVRFLPAFATLTLLCASALPRLKDHQAFQAYKKYAKKNRIILAVVLCYCLFILISAGVHQAGRELITASGMVVVIFLMHFLFPLVVREERDVRFIFKSLFFITSICIVLSLALFAFALASGLQIGVYLTKYQYDKRVFLEQMHIPFVLEGLFIQPSFLGGLVAMTFPGALSIIAETKSRRQNILFYSCLGLCIAAGLGALAIISLIPVFAVILLHRYMHRKSVFSLVKTLIISSVLCSNVLFLSGIDLHFLGRFPVTSKGRVEIWTKAWPLIRDHFIFGLGPNEVSPALPHGWAAHNTFLETGLAYGVPAMLLYSIYFVLLTLRIPFSPERRLTPYILLSFMTFSFIQLFVSQVFGGLSIANFLFLLIGLSFLSIRSEDKRPVVELK